MSDASEQRDAKEQRDGQDQRRARNPPRPKKPGGKKQPSPPGGANGGSGVIPAAGFASRWQQVLELGAAIISLSDEAQPEASLAAIYATLAAQRKLILEACARLTNGPASLWLSKSVLPGFAARLPDRSLVDQTLLTEAPPSGLMRKALSSQMVCASRGPDEAEIAEGEHCYPQERPWATAVAAPLLARGRTSRPPGVLGVLQVERRDGPPFGAGEIELIDGLAVQAALAMQADRKTVTERWRVAQLDLVRRVSAQLADARNLDELAQRVTDLILRTFNYYYVAVFTLEPGQTRLRFRASAGPLQPAGKQGQSTLPAGGTTRLDVDLGEGVIGQAALNGQEILANDVSLEPRYQYVDALPETRSEAVLPLKIEDRVLGVMDVQSDRPDDFHEIDMLVLRALAGNIAIAVEEARLYSDLQRRADQLATVSEVSSAITSILDQDELLNEVVTLIHDNFGYPFVHLFSVHPGRRKIFYDAGSGARSQILHEQGYALDLDDPQGLIPWVARNGETILSNDVETEPRYRPSPLPPDNTRSELTVPLIFGGEVLAVLDVQSDQPNAFSEDDRFLFEALADTIAVALRNAFLYRSKSWRRQVADSLREVAGLLSADADLDQVLEAILVELERTLPCDVAAIWLLDEDQDDLHPSGDLPHLQLAAVHGEAAAGVDGNLLDEDLTLAQTLSVPPGDPEMPKPFLALALEADEPIIRTSESLFDPLGAALGFPPDYSAIAAPLKVGDQRLGVLALAHGTAGRYGTEARGMTAAFASYAAVAIENTRLFEAAHEQAWISTVLLQVAEATQSLTNLNELLATVTRLTPMLTGVKACALYMLDEDGSFVPAASAGLAHDQQLEFERWRFSPGEVPAFDGLLEQPAPLILHGDAEDPRLADILFSTTPADSLFVPELLVVVPLVARGEVLGAFVIDYSDTNTEDLSPESLEALFDERLAILQGIAHQTAIAVENIHLLKAQKEEAYVSVALLQVAQAIVSSSELDETLGAIVRITPILVGVKRAVMYLWEPARQAFWQSQAYGLPHSIGGFLYPAGQFPLLDAVRESGRLLAYPLDDEFFDEEDIPETWADIPPPGPEEVEAYLESEDCLLLAFPLTVKGEVLGVLLVEEPDPVPLESQSGLSANRRLRSKRLEITTGISQQVALAIQNDQLQSEMVERERLEREMQLARDIQRTFLPDQIPDLPGWAMDTHWQTAREVGGDFYDFFSLPDQRLGLVIADVADKGMPAALFMTLVRTLVRATVREFDSPAAVLKRVNDVLVPDARGGMFVTLFYAVVDLESGRVTYANAGHNPPLVANSTASQITRLLKTGMALGVLETSQYSQQSIDLQPGDALVLYTDGITEAFSPEGELFGEDRLHQVVAAAMQAAREPDANDAAKEIVSAVEALVTAFLGPAAPGDDLTLLVLQRSLGNGVAG